MAASKCANLSSILLATPTISSTLFEGRVLICFMPWHVRCALKCGSRCQNMFRMAGIAGMECVSLLCVGKRSESSNPSMVFVQWVYAS